MHITDFWKHLSVYNYTIFIITVFSVVFVCSNAQVKIIINHGDSVALLKKMLGR